MGGLTAKCLNGHVFRSNAIEVVNSTVTMEGGSTDCPYCGAYARFLDGTFHVDASGVMTVLAAPEVTHDILRRVNDAIESGARGEIERDEVLQRLDQIDSKIADVVKAMSKSNGWPDQLLWAVISAIIGVLMGIALARAQGSSAGPTDEELRSQIQRVVDDVIAQNAPPPASIAPSPVTTAAKPVRRTSPATPGGPNRAARRAAMKPKRP